MAAYLLGCGLAVYMKDDKPDTGLNRLCKIIISESAHLIWKLRCERRIAREDGPQKFHSEREIHNRWVQAMNSRLTIDSLSTNTKKFGRKATKARIVLQTWEGCLLRNGELPRNWCGKKGVLVGIAPVRRERRRWSSPRPSAESHTVPSRWPVRKGISSRCLMERSCAPTD